MGPIQRLDLWLCLEPGGNRHCNTLHQSERTALKCCGKRSGATPHRIDCPATYYGCSHPCDCNALERRYARRGLYVNGSILLGPGPLLVTA